MKSFIVFLFLIISSAAFGQRDSLNLGEHYAEDQLYFLISYNQLHNEPVGSAKSRFSYGLSGGFMKDFILNKKGSVSVALGVGYSYDYFNHGLRITETNQANIFDLDNSSGSNKLFMHSIEFPFEIRWRNSDARTYSFWRIYTGIKASYNFANSFRYESSSLTERFRNIPEFNTWQLGLTMSVGYDAFTAHIYYGLDSIYENAQLNGTGASIDSKIIKIGLILYLL